MKISDLKPGMVIRYADDYIVTVQRLIHTAPGKKGKTMYWWSVLRERDGVSGDGVLFGPDDMVVNVETKH